MSLPTAMCLLPFATFNRAFHAIYGIEATIRELIKTQCSLNVFRINITPRVTGNLDDDDTTKHRRDCHSHGCFIQGTTHPNRSASEPLVAILPMNTTGTESLFERDKIVLQWSGKSNAKQLGSRRE